MLSQLLAQVDALSRRVGQMEAAGLTSRQPAPVHAAQAPEPMMVEPATPEAPPQPPPRLRSPTADDDRAPRRQRVLAPGDALPASPSDRRHSPTPRTGDG
mmetsp:Transcript_10438/g.42224  ORF Transcript_10438/g.42224 Transcript_10438/m.42224 type:complete len:100 (+) Transcript_10438:772-1071(+)